MNKVLFSIVIFLLVSNWELNCQNDTFLVGAARNIITPTDTAYIAGHSFNRIFKGVHDDLYVQSVIISNQSTSIIFLTFDCIGLLYPQLLEIRKAVEHLIPECPISQIVMSSSHTHSGPDVVGIWGKDILHSGVDSNYMNILVKIAAQTIHQAWVNRVISHGEYGTSVFGKNWVFNISEPNELDLSVNVLRFRDQYGHNIATLTNFACHPTFLDGENEKVSADYVGGYYKRLLQKQGGINIFLQGAIGGWVQPEYEEKTHEQAFYRGSELADEVIKVLMNPKSLSSNQILFKSMSVYLPVDNPGFKQLSAIGVLSRDFTDSVLTEIAYFEVGNAAFATHPGETVPALSLATKEMMTNDGPRFILGLGMDALGYILKPGFFNPDNEIPHSTYLCSVSLGVNTQEHVLRALKSLITRR